MSNVSSLVKKYVSLVEELKTTGKELGEKLVEAIKPVIPDVYFTFGWEESGFDCICFWSHIRETWSLLKSKSLEEIVKDKVSLDSVIEEVFPELERYVDCPFGVYLNK